MLFFKILRTFIPSLMIGLAFSIPSYAENSTAAKWFIYPLANIALILFLGDLKKIWTGYYDK